MRVLVCAPEKAGWVAYYRMVVSTRVFAALTDYLWKLTYKWACWSHPNKPRHWIIGRYSRRPEILWPSLRSSP